MQIMSIRKFTFVPYFVNHRAFHFFLPHANFSREQSLFLNCNHCQVSKTQRTIGNWFPFSWGHQLDGFLNWIGEVNWRRLQKRVTMSQLQVSRQRCHNFFFFAKLFTWLGEQYSSLHPLSSFSFAHHSQLLPPLSGIRPKPFGPWFDLAHHDYERSFGCLAHPLH